MRNEFTAVVERAGRRHIAYCPEIPGANGQGRTKGAALKSLANAIALILEDRRRDGLRGVRGRAGSLPGSQPFNRSSPASVWNC